MQSPEQSLRKMGIELPDSLPPKGIYHNVLLSGNLVMTSGHLPADEHGNLIVGKLGKELDQDAGFVAARQAGLAVLASLREALESLDRIERVIKILGFVNASPEFTAHPAVINGCSELFRDVFGDENGVGIRSAVGTSSLPLGVAVELEAVFEVNV
jgi:enamine deaminase RidA (YjgF/YER057c/UK114 family)